MSREPNKHSKDILAKSNAAKKELFIKVREGMDPTRILLGLTAIKQRLEQELTITVAGWEIDQIVINPAYRVHSDPSKGIENVLQHQARLDATEELITYYRSKIPEPAPLIPEVPEGD